MLYRKLFLPLCKQSVSLSQTIIAELTLKNINTFGLCKQKDANAYLHIGQGVEIQSEVVTDVLRGVHL